MKKTEYNPIELLDGLNKSEVPINNKINMMDYCMKNATKKIKQICKPGDMEG